MIERAVEVFAIINFVIIGLSHTFQPHAWVDFFVPLRECGRAGVFVAAFLALMFGSIVVAFHNVWTGIPIVLTLMGWAQVIKAFIYFVFPSVGLRKLQMPSHERAHQFIYPGLVFLVLAGLLGYHLIATR
jgi:hypothetical protein